MDNDIIKLIEEGHSNIKIAQILGVNHNKVGNRKSYLTRNGLLKKKVNVRAVIWGNIEKCVSMRLDGSSISEILASLNIEESPSTRSAFSRIVVMYERSLKAKV